MFFILMFKTKNSKYLKIIGFSYFWVKTQIFGFGCECMNVTLFFARKNLYLIALKTIKGYFENSSIEL